MGPIDSSAPSGDFSLDRIDDQALPFEEALVDNYIHGHLPTNEGLQNTLSQKIEASSKEEKTISNIRKQTLSTKVDGKRRHIETTPLPHWIKV